MLSLDLEPSTIATSAESLASQVNVAQSQSAETAAVNSAVPDFRSYTNVQQKKADFFNYMLPMIQASNARILAQRARLHHALSLVQRGQPLTIDDEQFINRTFRQYRVAVPAQIHAPQLQALLARVDVVPASLVLAQSANESGWGTSRFARQANNFFGIWCFTEGCGLTPLRRDAGLSHEVARYDSVADGVAAYMMTINTHAAYESLRDIRSMQRNGVGAVCGEELAEGLVMYSERGMDYVREIQKMILANNLAEFNNA